MVFGVNVNVHLMKIFFEKYPLGAWRNVWNCPTVWRIWYYVWRRR